MRRLLLLCVLFFAGVVFGGGTVPDTTQSSAKIGDILTDPKNVDKLDNIIMGVGYGSQIVKWGVENKGKNLGEAAKETFTDMGKDMVDGVKNIGVAYKNSKGSFMVFMRTTREVLLDILNTASDRIDMWRTTLPTLQAWGKATRKLVDNTKEVYRSFKWKDLWDIDRKWSRKMEKVNMKWINRSYEFMDYLWSLGDVSVADRFGNYLGSYELDSSIYGKEKYKELTLIKIEIEKEEEEAMENLTEEGKRYLFDRLPLTAQETAITSLVSIGDIIEGSVSDKDSIHEILQNRMSQPRITYMGSMALLSSIKQHRADVEAQKTALRQIQSNLSSMYARVQMMGMEKVAVTQGEATEELKKIMGVSVTNAEDGQKYRDAWYSD